MEIKRDLYLDKLIARKHNVLDTAIEQMDKIRLCSEYGTEMYSFAMNIGGLFKLLHRDTIGLNCVRYAQANNPFSAYNTLVEIKDSNTDKLLDICVLGSKPMALGACLFALRNPQIVKVSYPFPKASRVHTSIEDMLY